MLIRRLFTAPRHVENIEVLPDIDLEPNETFFQDSINPFPDLPHVEITVFSQAHTNDILIIVPGYDSDGKSSKYQQLIKTLQSKTGCAIILTNDLETEDYQGDILNQMEKILIYALENSEQITGNPRYKVNLKLLGSSAGGGVVAAISRYCRQIKELTLLGPTEDVGIEMMQKGLSEFSGELTIVRGEFDPKCTEIYANKLISYAGNSKPQIISISKADHGFTSQANVNELCEVLVETNQNREC